MFAEPILVAMKTPKDSLQLAITYTRVIFYGLPFSYMYAFVMSVLRGAGDSKTPFKFLLVSVALDIILNPLLIFGLGPLPKLGIAARGMPRSSRRRSRCWRCVAHLYRIKHPLRIGGP